MQHLILQPLPQLTFQKSAARWTVVADKYVMPEELIEAILRCFNAKIFGDHRVLLKCLRISQQFRRIGLHVAYTTATCKEDPATGVAFIRLFQHFATYPSIAHTVTTLSLSISKRGAVRTLFHEDRWPAVTTCTLIDVVGTLLPRLQLVRLDGVHIASCNDQLHRHVWGPPIHLPQLYLHNAYLPPQAIIGFSDHLVCIDIDLLKIGLVSGSGTLDRNHGSSRVIAPAPGPYSLTVSAVEVHPATQESLKQITRLEIRGLKSVQAQSVAWSAWRVVRKILEMYCDELEVLVLYMQYLHIEDIHIPGEIWSKLPWKACRSLQTAVLAMSFNELHDIEITHAQFQWFSGWLILLPATVRRVRLVIEGIDVDEDTMVDWLLHHFPWEEISNMLRRQHHHRTQLEIELVHDRPLWEQEDVQSMTRFWLQEYIEDESVKLRAEDWFRFPPAL